MNQAGIIIQADTGAGASIIIIMDHCLADQVGALNAIATTASPLIRFKVLLSQDRLRLLAIVIKTLVAPIQTQRLLAAGLRLTQTGAGLVSQ
jgi:hypothetical protein